MNITTLKDFESVVPSSALDDVRDKCYQLSNNSATCSSCTVTLGNIKAGYLNGSDKGNNVTDCTSYPAVYAAGVVTATVDDDSVLCLFALDSATVGTGSSSSIQWVIGVVVGGVFLLVGGALIGLWRRKRKRRRRRMREMSGDRNDCKGAGSVAQLETIQSHTTLVRYTFDEIKSSTNGLSVRNIIGRGGYGNVYRGILPDGSEIAVKRFKNISAGGDEDFAHEVEVIASVCHINLLPLRGYCVAKSQRFVGHERITVCDLVTKGSLHDHLFGDDEKRRKLSWPIRQKIAIGMARGIAYLHHGAQPAIIHRDIKASNILLDDEFEPKVADFGLAKFSPEGATHLSTRVAGTLGYVAPEYALFGKLTDRSDVYSFGVLLLELISGKKAIVENTNTKGEALMLSDWAWEMVKEGRALDVVDNCISELPTEKMVLEKYVRIGILCSHPQLQERPLMLQVLKLMETDLKVPIIRERPISLISNINVIERSSNPGSSGSGHSSSLISKES